MKLKLKNTKLFSSIIAFGLCSTIVGSYFPETYIAKTISQNSEVKDYMMLDITSERVIDEESLTEYTRYYYSYDGMTPQELKEKGLHVAIASSQDGKTWGAWSDLAMYAFEPGTFDNFGGYIKFAVVDYPMDNLFSYKGDLAENGKALEVSEVYSNDLDYVRELSAPYIISVTPSNQTILEPGVHKVTAKFDEHLEQLENTDLSVSSEVKNAFGIKANVSNISINNTTEKTILGTDRDVSIVTFDLETDLSYGSHYADYRLQLNGVTGKYSKKAPNTINFVTAYKMTQCYGVFDGIMRAEAGSDINNFDAENYKFEKSNLADSGVVIVKTKNNESTARHLFLNCEEEAERFNYLTNITIGVCFADGFFEDDATYTAYRYVPQKDGSYKRVDLNTEITSRGLKINGVNTLK